MSHIVTTLTVKYTGRNSVLNIFLLLEACLTDIWHYLTSLLLYRPALFSFSSDSRFLGRAGEPSTGWHWMWLTGSVLGLQEKNMVLSSLRHSSQDRQNGDTLTVWAGKMVSSCGHLTGKTMTQHGHQTGKMVSQYGHLRWISSGERQSSLLISVGLPAVGRCKAH